MKSLLCILSILLPTVLAADNGFRHSPEQLQLIIDQSPLTPIEGIWTFTPDNSSIAIIRQPGSPLETGPTSFNIYLFSSVSSTVESGTLIGTLRATADPLSFKASLMTDPMSANSKEKKVIMALTDNAHLSFKKIETGLRISLWRLIPYLFRISVISKNSDDIPLDGCVKTYPLTPGETEPPRYL